MPGSCCAPNCKSNYDVKGPRVRVYRFPRDQKKRAAWTKALARENFTPSLHTVVCEKHFVPSDFIRTSTYTDVQTGRVIEVRLERLRLKQSAVPSVFPSCPNTSRPTASTLDVHRDEKTHSQDQLNKVVWEHSVYKCRSIAPAACSTKVLQADLVPPVKLTVDVAAGPSHSVCGVSSSTQAVTIKLDGGTQTCPSDFDDHPNSSVMPRLQDSMCHRKFRDLNDTFVKIGNQVKMTTKSGATDIATIKWNHFRHVRGMMEPVSRDPMNLQDQAELPGTLSSSVHSNGSATTVVAAAESHLETRETRDSDVERTPRLKKVRRSPREQQRPLAIAACMERLHSRTERHQQQPQDAVYHMCMALAEQLRTLNQRDQLDAMFEIHTMMYNRLQRVMKEENSN
uniref:THAP-type domain-containing protein n=1 Tax=Amblyomma maculatum TaxID=34609 RepID=G3MTB3_AMBMU